MFNYKPQGRWLMAQSYSEMQMMPLPIDGSPTMVMLETEPVLYMLSMENGRKMIQGYEIKPLQVSSIDERLARLEQLLGGNVNESNYSANEKSVEQPDRQGERRKR